MPYNFDCRAVQLRPYKHIIYTLNKKTRFTAYKINPSEPAPEHSVVLDFTWLQKVLLTFPPRANSVLKYTGWHASNGRLKITR